MNSLYDILGLKPDAEPAAIKYAYRALAQRWHPDKADGDEERFTDIGIAYAVLKDPEKRARYDATGAIDDAVRVDKVANALAQLFTIVIDRLETQGGKQSRKGSSKTK